MTQEAAAPIFEMVNGMKNAGLLEGYVGHPQVVPFASVAIARIDEIIDEREELGTRIEQSEGGWRRRFGRFLRRLARLIEES